LKFEYRKGSAHQNADALSRWPLPDQDEEGFDDYNDIVINVIIFETENSLMKIQQKSVTHANLDQFIEFTVQLIGFEQINGDHMQESDLNIQFIINQMKQRTILPEQDQIKNAVQRIYVKEWNNLLLNDKILWRKSKDILGQDITQLVLPACNRTPMIEKMHSNLLSGHLMMDKTFARMTARFFWPLHDI
jgi:hypothetical protein